MQPAGAGLRRRFELGLIFSLITLLVQLIAPVSATYGMANANPLDAMPICAHVSEDNGTPAPSGHDKACPCCTLCTIAQSAFVPRSDVPSAIAAPQRLPQRPVFVVASFIPATRPSLPLAQPRAPPAFS